MCNYFLPAETLSEIYRGTSPRCGAIKKVKRGSKIGQANIIRPSIATDRDLMAATIVGAIDQKPANTRAAHFCEGDFLRAGGHAP
jgi:hypothetical protein